MGFWFGVRVELCAVEADDSVASQLLGNVEGIVRRAKHRFGIGDAGVRPCCHPAAHRPLERTAVVGKSMLCYALPQPIGESNGRIKNGSRQKQEELFSSIAAHAVDFPRFGFEDAGELLQNFVPRLMPVGVVHFLEMIDVAHDARDGLVQAV